jgi:hypothetical protein
MAKDNGDGNTHTVERKLGSDPHQVAVSIAKSGAQIVQNVVTGKGDGEFSRDKKDQLQDRLAEVVESAIVATLSEDEDEA